MTIRQAVVWQKRKKKIWFRYVPCTEDNFKENYLKAIFNLAEGHLFTPNS